MKGLQSEIQKTKEENHQQVTKLKAKVKEKEEKWEGVSLLYCNALYNSEEKLNAVTMKFVNTEVLKMLIV